jgi:hypothetical protein
MKATITRLVRLCAFIAVLVSATHACLNPIGRSTVGDTLYYDELDPESLLKALTTHEGKAYWLKVLADLKLSDARYSFAEERQTNTSVAMLHLGMVRPAIRILEDIERRSPGLYYTAANLGTAYELNGENAKALEWIKKGIEREPNSHHASEWLHVKILEAKLELEKDPNWLASNPVIPLENVSKDQLDSSQSVAKGNREEPIDLQQVEAALIYQLHERLEFIKPPDGVVADLLFDLSRTLALTRSLDHSTAVARFAQTYGPDLTPWPASGPFLPAVELPPPPSTTSYWIGGSTVLGVALAMVVLLFARASRRRVSAPKVRE